MPPPVPAGWTRDTWIERMRQLADTCQANRPDRAREWRALADELDGAGAVGETVPHARATPDERRAQSVG